MTSSEDSCLDGEVLEGSRNEVATDQNPNCSRKSPYIFKTAEDIRLLKEVIVSKPYAAGKKEIGKCWARIADRLGKKYSADCARQRFQKILKTHISNESPCKQRSGTEEEYTERVRLLTDISEDMDNINLIKKASSPSGSRVAIDKDKAESLRNAAMEGLVVIKEKEGVHVGKKRSKSVFELMAEEQEAKIKIRESEIAIEHKKLDIEDRRLKLQEDESKLLAEERRQSIEERKQMMEIFQNINKKT